MPLAPSKHTRPEDSPRLVKQLKRTIFVEFTGQPLPAPCLAISRPMAHTHHQ
jgi:hypothetical protein